MPLRMEVGGDDEVKYRTHRHTTIPFNDKPYSHGGQGLPRDIADLGGTRYRPVGTGGPRICAYKPTSQGTGVLGRFRANYLALLGFTREACLVQGETLHRTISRACIAEPGRGSPPPTLLSERTLGGAVRQDRNRNTMQYHFDDFFSRELPAGVPFFLLSRFVLFARLLLTAFSL